MAGFLRTLITLAVVTALGRIAWRAYLNPADWSREQRARVAQQAMQRGVHVAIVWPQRSPLHFLDGVHLALGELQQSGGPWADAIRLSYFDEPPFASGRDVAQRVARRHDIVAVIGHRSSETAMPASVTYEAHGILFLAPMATLPGLTMRGFHYVFRLTPDLDPMAECMTDFARLRKFHRVGVLGARSIHGEALATRFDKLAIERGLEISFVRSYPVLKDGNEWDFRPLIAEIRARPFDALVLADSDTRSANVVLYLRQMGVRQPILGSHGLDSDALWEVAKGASLNVFVASVADANSPNPAYRGFEQRFRVRYGRRPDYGASQGYQSMSVLIRAIEMTHSADPLAVASTLRSTPAWPGIWGDIAFTPEGDLSGGVVVIKEMQRDGVFRVVYREKGGHRVASRGKGGQP